MPNTSTNVGLAPEEPKLKSGALSPISVLMQAITHIAPGAGFLLSIQFIVSQSGGAAPLAFGIAFLIILTLGISLTQLAKHLRSSGGYFTYLSRTVHPRAGFITAWLYFLYDPLGAAINIAFLGFVFQNTTQANWGFTFPWWLTFLILTAFVTFMMYRGVELAGRTMAVLGTIEILILVAIAVSGLAHPGNGGFNFKPFSMHMAPSMSGLFLGVVFSIFSFTGFESVAPLAEESRNPKKTLPRAIILSIVIMGVFYMLTSWGAVVGWGTNNVHTLINSKENPVFVMGKRLWGTGWILLLFAMFNSIAAVSIACNNAATRVFYSMGKVGSLPRGLAKVHPRFKTPVNALILQTIITLVVGLGLGFLMGPDQEFYLLGVVVTLGLTFVYGMGNIGVFRYYLRERRSEFNWLLHLVFPLISTLAILYVAYKSVIPLPAPPVNFAPFIVVIWLVVGLILLWWFSRTGKESWLIEAGRAAYDAESDEQ